MSFNYKRTPITATVSVLGETIIIRAIQKSLDGTESPSDYPFDIPALHDPAAAKTTVPADHTYSLGIQTFLATDIPAHGEMIVVRSLQVTASDALVVRDWLYQIPARNPLADSRAPVAVAQMDRELEACWAGSDANSEPDLVFGE